MGNYSHLSSPVSGFLSNERMVQHQQAYPHKSKPENYRPIKPGLEKLTNANRSVCSVSDRLFPVELTEIADWKSMSEYMLHSNFGKALTGVIGGNFGAYTFILPLPCLLNICLSFWMFYRRKKYLNKIKILRNFRE